MDYLLIRVSGCVCSTDTDLGRDKVIPGLEKALAPGINRGFDESMAMGDRS
jgi:hypothetical protein